MPDAPGTERLCVRNAAPEDLPDVLECLRSAFEPFRGDYTEGAFESTVLNAETLQKRFLKMQVLVVAGADQKVMGTVSYSIVDGEGFIRGMAVRPEFHGSGAASALLRKVEDDLARLRCPAVRLTTTRPLSRAIAFYERHGFRRTGKVSLFFGMDLIEYRKVLGATY